MAKNLIVVNKALFDAFPSLVIAAVSGNSPELNPNETIKLDFDQTSWLGENQTVIKHFIILLKRVAFAATLAVVTHPIGGVFGGRLCDAYGRRKVMMAITVPLFIAFFMLSFAQSFEVIGIGFAVLGFVFGLKEAPTITYVIIKTIFFFKKTLYSNHVLIISFHIMFRWQRLGEIYWQLIDNLTALKDSTLFFDQDRFRVVFTTLFSFR